MAKTDESLPKLELTPELLLGRTTILYGESNSGKSTIIVDILKTLHNIVRQILVICPSDPVNKTYSKNGFIDEPLIHTSIPDDFLELLFERQKAVIELRNLASKPENLKKLIDRTTSCAEIDNFTVAVEKIRQKNIENVKEGEMKDNEIMEINSKFKDIIVKIYKECVKKHESFLTSQDLDEKERFTLNHYNINTKCILIFDDCTTEIARLKKHPLFQEIFYLGRHLDLTTIIAAHTDKSFEPELKKNAFLSIFCEETSANTFIDRPSNNLDKKAKIRAHVAKRLAFTSQSKHQKLVWVRDEKKYFRFTAKCHPPFKFTSPILTELCNKATNSGEHAPVENRFLKQITIPV